MRRARAEDIPALVACHAAVYGGNYAPGDLYGADIYGMQLAAFPEGQLVVELGNTVVGYATSLIVQLADDDAGQYDYEQITGGGTFSTHDPAGDTLYGADIGVHPDHRGQGLAGLLYLHRKRLMTRLNLRRMLAYGRIPGYAADLGKLTARQYVDAVVRGELRDPALTAHLKAGYRVLAVRLDYMPDPASLNYSTLLEMPNPQYDAARRKIAAVPIARPFRKVRVCAAQYMFRPIRDWAELESSVRFFARTADAYHCHILVLPELFVVALLSSLPSDLPARDAMRYLADQHERYLGLFRELARHHRLYILAGTTPVTREGKVYNVAHLFTPSGQVYTQDKLHITPAEREQWGIQPGEEIKVFDTPLGRFGIQVCYDIEFPELSRLQTFAGAEALLVPFSTDDPQAYRRVRFTAQARAIENLLYVVLAGNTGNLPTHAYLINYAQSVVLTPSDFGFPPHAVAAEGDANTETVAIADLDFGTLAQVREIGSVRPLYDRRPDLYDLRLRQHLRLERVE